MSKVRARPGLEHITAYVPGRSAEDVQRELGLDDLVKLASNESPLAPSSKALAAMEAALSHVTSYPQGDSYRVRQALASHLQVEPDNVVLGNGIDGLIMETCMAYIDQGDEVVLSRSSYPEYDIFAQAMRGRLVKTPLKDYGLDLEAMLSAITPRTKLVFVCNPNNPTGTIVTTDEVDWFVREVRDNVLVVFDEAYCDFVGTRDYPDTLPYVRERRDNVLLLRTFSKSYGLAGIRLGYGIAHPDLLSAINKVREPFAVNLLAQAAGIAALQDAEYLRRSVAANAEGREFLFREFVRLGLFCVKSHTNFLMVQIGPDAERVMQALLAGGVIVRPCVGYGLPEFLRITVGDSAQNVRLVEALSKALESVGK